MSEKSKVKEVAPKQKVSQEEINALIERLIASGKVISKKAGGERGIRTLGTC